MLEQQGAAVRLRRTQILVAYGLIIIVYSSEIAIGGGLKIILDISGINIRYTACLGRNQKLDSAVGMSLAVTFVMVLATAATWPIQMFLLTPPGSEGTARDLGYLQTIVFILIIAILVQLLENILKKFIPTLYKSLGVYLPLITTNCTILGVTILNIDNGYNFMESIVCAAGAGIGFLGAMVLFSGVRRKVEEAVTPKCFEGLPITLVSAAVTSLSFMGFGGIIESIFHV